MPLNSNHDLDNRPIKNESTNEQKMDMPVEMHFKTKSTLRTFKEWKQITLLREESNVSNEAINLPESFMRRETEKLENTGDLEGTSCPNDRPLGPKVAKKLHTLLSKCNGLKNPNKSKVSLEPKVLDVAKAADESKVSSESIKSKELNEPVESKRSKQPKEPHELPKPKNTNERKDPQEFKGPATRINPSESMGSNKSRNRNNPPEPKDSGELDEPNEQEIGKLKKPMPTEIEIPKIPKKPRKNEPVKHRAPMKLPTHQMSETPIPLKSKTFIELPTLQKSKSSINIPQPKKPNSHIKLPELLKEKAPTDGLVFNDALAYLNRASEIKNASRSSVDSMKVSKKSKMSTIKTHLTPDEYDPDFFCRACVDTFQTKGSYRKHLRKVHKMVLSPPNKQDKYNPNKLVPLKDDPDYYCRSCGIKKKTKQSYLQHLMIVHNIR